MAVTNLTAIIFVCQLIMWGCALQRKLVDIKSMGISFRHTAAFAKRIKYYVVDLMLREGPDV